MTLSGLSVLTLTVLVGACGDSSLDGVPSGDDATGGSGGNAVGASGTENASAGGAPSGNGGTRDAGTGGVAGSAGMLSTGGTTNPGGNGGNPSAGRSDGGPPTVVGACDSLPAAGTWQNISPSEALAPYTKPVGPSTSGIKTVVTHPNLQGTVYIVGIDRGLFKSQDCGATWKHINTGTNGSLLDRGGLDIAINPLHPDIFYAWASYGAGGVWKSTDGGVNWIQKFTGTAATVFDSDFVQYVTMDPTNPDHLVASPHGSCVGPVGAACMVETYDGGENWRVFKAPAFAESGGVGIVADKNWLYAAGFGGLLHTIDAGATWTPISGVNVAWNSFYHNDAHVSYVATGSGVVMGASSSDAMWSLIHNSPATAHVMGDGVNLFTCDQWSSKCSRAAESMLSEWKSFPSPPELPPANYGASMLASDRGHHILYYTSLNASFPGFQGGVWRMVTF